jgi:hypothetical protein
MPVPSGTVSTLSWALPLGGVTLFILTLGVVRHSWARRLKKWHGWFYHPDELKALEPKEEQEPEEVGATALLHQVEPLNWDYSMYEERERDD